MRVVAERMKESVAIGRDAARAVCDRLTQAPAGIDASHLEHLRSVNIHVGRRIVFEGLDCSAVHIDRCAGASQRETGFELDWKRVLDFHTLGEGAEAGGGYLKAIWIGRDIAQTKGAVRAGFRRLAVAGDRIPKSDLSLDNDPSGRVGHDAFDRARVAKRLGCGAIHRIRQKQAHDSESEDSHIASRMRYILRRKQPISATGRIAPATRLLIAVNGGWFSGSGSRVLLGPVHPHKRFTR